MNSLSLEALRESLEGVVPAHLATCSPDGVPNTAWISQVDYVDSEHVALSYQFFNKTRQNILANPFAEAAVVNPCTAQVYRLGLRYLRTETEGKVFQRMKARLAGIASHTGMAGVFKLQGADIYRVERIEAVPGKVLAPLAPRPALAPALRACCERLAACGDLAALLDAVLTGLRDDFGIAHAMVLMWDASAQRLYTVASHGYARSGVGSEIALGEGVIGVAAEHRTPIRIAHMTNEYSYGRAIREGALREGMAAQVQEEIPFPGLDMPHSQLAVPILATNRLMGVLYVESMEDRRFSYDHEDMLVTLALQLGVAMALLAQGQEAVPEAPAVRGVPPPTRGEELAVRHYAPDHSVFLGDDYLIKGVAGAIIWRLLRHFVDSGRNEFSNRELRLDASLRLPDIDDNLEARLILLARRLAERCDWMSIEKTGRGRFRLCVRRPVRLVEAG